MDNCVQMGIFVQIDTSVHRNARPGQTTIGLPLPPVASVRHIILQGASALPLEEQGPAIIHVQLCYKTSRTGSWCGSFPLLHHSLEQHVLLDEALMALVYHLACLHLLLAEQKSPDAIEDDALPKLKSATNFRCGQSVVEGRVDINNLQVLSQDPMHT